MKLTKYKINDDERKQAEELLSKYIPHISSMIDYDKYFETFLNVSQLSVLCKYFACNIAGLAGEVKSFKEINQGKGKSCYAGPP